MTFLVFTDIVQNATIFFYFALH